MNQHNALEVAGPAERNAPAGLDAHPAMASDRAIVGWLLFDWACQPFFTLVTTFVFAPYFAAVAGARSGDRSKPVGLCHRGGGL